jgi:DNA polymerase-1
MSAAELLARRPLLALVPWAPSGDLLMPAAGVALSALDGDALLELDDGGRALLNAWSKRRDRVFVLDEARPALRRLLRADVDVARPICRATLEKLAGDTRGVEDTGQILRDPIAARERAKQIVHKLEGQLARVDEAGHKKVARLESLVLRPFAALEDRGLPVDAVGWKALVDEQRALAKAARDELLVHAGAHVPRDLFGTPEINLDAEADVRTLLERVLGRKLDADASLAKHALAQIDHPLVRALLAYREANKVVTTYGDAFLSRVDTRTQRIHATFVPLGASTGRVASRDPNLQNLPGDERFHRCLRAPEGRVLVTADYATCELRIVAELAGDPVFLRAFEAGEDLHARVASTMFGKPVSKTENPDLRARAKGINFGLVYGMGAPALAMSIGVDVNEGERLLAQYFKTFPKIRDYLERSVETGLRKGYAETVLGRRLVFDKDTLHSSNARGELGRIAKNMPIQGTSADMTKLAMVRVHERLVDETTPSSGGRATAGLVNTIHDELVVECDAADGERVATAVREEMSEAHRSLLKTVPPLVEVHVGPHWHH